MYARQFGKGGRPVHVAVAHQDELRVDSLRKERFCEGFVEFWHGRGTLGWRPADGTLAAVAIIGIRHLPLAAPRKRYIRLARRRKGASSFFLPHKSPLLARSVTPRAGWRIPVTEVRRCTGQVANRLEASPRIVVQLSHMRLDDNRRRDEQQGITIGRGARNSFGSNDIGRPRAVLNQHRQSLRPADLLGQQASLDVGGAARGERNDDLDRSRHLRPCTRTGRRKKREGKGSESDATYCKMQK